MFANSLAGLSTLFLAVVCFWQAVGAVCVGAACMHACVRVCVCVLGLPVAGCCVCRTTMT